MKIVSKLMNELKTKNTYFQPVYYVHVLIKARKKYEYIFIKSA